MNLINLICLIILINSTVIFLVKCYVPICGVVRTDCDCMPNINKYAQVYTIQCPTAKPTSNFDFDRRRVTYEIHTSAYESQLTINCHTNAIGTLVNIPRVLRNLTKFRTINFISCFNNKNNTFADEEFNLNNFIQLINLNLDDLTLRLIFKEFSFIDEYQFFNKFQFKNYFSVILKNIGFSSSDNSSILFSNLLKTKHIEFINNNLINFNNFAFNTTLMTIEIEKNHINNLNKLNLAKFPYMYKFQLIDCGVDRRDFNAEKLFENNNLVELVLKNITAVSVSSENNNDVNGTYRNAVNFNKNLFVGVKRLRILAITHTKLYEIPENLFAPLSDIFTVDLSSNKLKNLPRNLFKNTLELHFLNLSSNNFVIFDDYQIFQQIRSLRKLYLDNNLLTEFHYNATGQTYFNELQLQRNQIAYNEDTTCPFTNITARIKINLSSNQIFNVQPLIYCFTTIEGITELNLENNLITEVQLKPITSSSVVLDRLFDNLFLAGNNITSIDILDEIDWETFAGEYKKTNLIVDLDSNPIFCENCALLQQMFNQSYVTVTSDYGTVVRFQHPHKCKLSSFCDEQIFYDHDYKCPDLCKCQYNEFSRIILIECIKQGLTKFPMIDYSKLIPVDNFILNLKDNHIKEFTTDGQNPEVFKRLKSINLENNLIETFNLPLVYNLVEEIFLKNNRLQITQELIKDLNTREIFVTQLQISLSGNNYCDSFGNLTSLFHTVHFSIVDKDLMTCDIKIQDGLATKASSRTGYSKIWIAIPLLLIVLAVLGGLVYYRSQVNETTAEFISRLRYRKANVEFETNLIHDDS